MNRSKVNRTFRSYLAKEMGKSSGAPKKNDSPNPALTLRDCYDVCEFFKDDYKH